jgi:ATP-dependent helicase/nuclease subunit B
MRRAAAEAAEAHDGSKLISDERFALKGELLCRELVNAALRIRAQFIGSEASIYSSEQEFSDYPVDTEFGEVMITGKIDRIDAANGYFRVVDYKSSATGFAMKDFLAGVRIQLPVYLAAAQRLMQSKGAGLRPAGGYYMRIGDACKESEEAVAKEARLSGISLNDPEVLKTLSAVNEDGSFAAIDQALSKSGELKAYGKNRFFKRSEMDTLLSHTDGLIRQAASAIYRGCNDISPIEGITSGNACAYCDYGSVCRMDIAYEGNAARRIDTAELFSESEGNEDELE